MKFLYKLDEISTNIPWYKPNSINLNKAINNILKLPYKQYFNVYLAGGFWSNDNTNTWDVDLFVKLNGFIIFLTSCSLIEFDKFILTVQIFFGLFFATSSIFVPPSELEINAILELDRSTKHDR